LRRSWYVAIAVLLMSAMGPVPAAGQQPVDPELETQPAPSYYFEFAASPFSQFAMGDWNRYVKQHNVSHPTTFFDEINDGVFANLEGGIVWRPGSSEGMGFGLGATLGYLRVNPASSPNHTLEVETVGLGPTARVFIPFTVGDHPFVFDLRGEASGLYTWGTLGDNITYTIIPPGDFRGFGYTGVLTGGVSYLFAEGPSEGSWFGAGLDLGYRLGGVPRVSYTSGTHEGSPMRTCVPNADGGCQASRATSPEDLGPVIGMGFEGLFLRIKLSYFVR
jgi:hypothetical protein